MLRVLKKQTLRNLISELWLSVLRSFHSFPTESDEWKIRKHYILTRIPSMLEYWRDHHPMYKVEQEEYNEVELSVVDISAQR